LEAALLAVPAHFEPAPILINSQRGDREKLAAWREQWQTQIIAATSAVLLIGFLFVILLVLQGTARAQRQRELLREVELETAEESELAEAPSFDAERWLVVLRAVIMILSIFTF